MSDEKKGPFHNPFGVLGQLRDALPVGPSKEEIEKKKAPARAVIRLERSGRKGKEVTVIDHLELSIEVRDQWLLEMKTALGCGGSIEGVALVLQGDQRDRIAKWLSKRGVKKIIQG